MSEANVDEPFLVECNGIEDKSNETTENKDEEGWESLLPLLEKRKYLGLLIRGCKVKLLTLYLNCKAYKTHHTERQQWQVLESEIRKVAPADVLLWMHSTFMKHDLDFIQFNCLWKAWTLL